MIATASTLTWEEFAPEVVSPLSQRKHLLRSREGVRPSNEPTTLSYATFPLDIIGNFVLAYQRQAENSRVRQNQCQRSDVLAGLEAYSYDDWDCEGARAITPDVIKWSEHILANILPNLPNPDASPAHSGSVCMEWTNGENLVWADVEPNGKLLTLTKFAGKKAELVFDIGDEAIRAYLNGQLHRLYS
jgi:hypothetical protein